MDVSIECASTPLPPLSHRPSVERTPSFSSPSLAPSHQSNPKPVQPQTPAFGTSAADSPSLHAAPNAAAAPDAASLTPEALEQILERYLSFRRSNFSSYACRLSCCCSCVGQLMGGDGAGPEVMQVMQQIAASIGSYSATQAQQAAAAPASAADILESASKEFLVSLDHTPFLFC